ncbi:hypothetical protein C1J03_13415 [Sulfitobacter sp. SK012]|nr:hypothetical protein C1J03_13415 [Sulfitobacter sp. SK012]
MRALKLVSIATMTLALQTAGATAVEAGSDWEFSITPFVWVAGLDGDIGTISDAASGRLHGEIPSDIRGIPTAPKTRHLYDWRRQGQDIQSGRFQISWPETANWPAVSAAGHFCQLLLPVRQYVCFLNSSGSSLYVQSAPPKRVDEA